MSQHEDTVRELVRAVESGDEDTIRDILADEIAVIGDDETVPQDEMAGNMLDLHDALEGMEYTIHNLWHDPDDDTYIAQVELTGTFANPIPMQPSPDAEEVTVEPTGEDVSGSFAYVLRFEDGEVAEFTGFQSLTMLKEMGVIEFALDTPSEAAAAEPAED